MARSIRELLLAADLVRPWHMALASLAAVAAVAVASLLTLWAPVDLQSAERSVFSQHGEDGVLERLLEAIEPGPRYVVEFGGGDGVTFSNSRNLLVNHGWSGLLIEGDPELAARSARAYEGHPAVRSIQAWVYGPEPKLARQLGG